MTDLYFKEIFEYPIKEFRDHLESPENERIIFSGKYGIGKTKFLENYFANENQVALFDKKEYDVYRLSPANYSIASNEDIFRYIKYDVIIEMLKNGLSVDEIKFSLLETFPEYLKKNIHKVVAALVNMIPKLGKDIVECFDRIDSLKEDYLKFHDNKNVSTGDRLIEYLEKMENNEGNVYESDITTKIISQNIKKNIQSKSILIIDDVDRVDPEHVFRILSVFASHFDSNSISGTKNKFSFDKIILVCDFNNIRNIFHHRYGLEVDFIGYIDKFYSSDIYYFDNIKSIKQIINKIFPLISIVTKANEDKRILYQFYFNNGFVADLISISLSQGLLSLRNLIKLSRKQIAYHYEKIEFDSRNSDVVAWLNPITMQLKLLRDLFGDYRNMKAVLEKLDFTDDFFENQKLRFGDLLYILSSKFHNYFGQTIFPFEFGGIKMIIDVKRRFGNNQYEYAYLFTWDGKKNETGTLEKGTPLDVSPIMFKDALLESISTLHSNGFLR